MKLQVAIDRVPLDKALSLVDSCKDVVDIIEVGTSLIKDYGMKSVREIRSKAPNVTVLADIKTMDEGAYEFEAAFAAGADIATVMGAAAMGTVAACCDVAAKKEKDIMIDLLETSREKIDTYREFTGALYCVHLPKDGPSESIIGKVSSFVEDYPGLGRVAVAGGITRTEVEILTHLPVEVCIVGSAITASEKPYQTAEEFARALNRT